MLKNLFTNHNANQCHTYTSHTNQKRSYIILTARKVNFLVKNVLGKNVLKTLCNNVPNFNATYKISGIIIPTATQITRYRNYIGVYAVN